MIDKETRVHLIFILTLIVMLLGLLFQNIPSMPPAIVLEPANASYDIMTSPVFVSNLINYSNGIVVIPRDLRLLINKTFYKSENESVIVFHYRLENEVLLIDSLEFPNITKTSSGSVSFLQIRGTNSTIHNHPEPLDHCIPSYGDMLNNFSVTGIYCNRGNTIMFYIAELNKTYYYNFTKW